MSKRQYYIDHPELKKIIGEKIKKKFKEGKMKASLIGLNSPENRKKAAITRKKNNPHMGAVLQKNYKEWKIKNPEKYEKAKEKARITLQSEECRKKASIKAKKWIEENPQKQKQIREKINKTNRKKENRQRMSEITKKRFESKEEREKASLKTKTYFKRNPEKGSERMKIASITLVENRKKRRIIIDRCDRLIGKHNIKVDRPKAVQGLKTWIEFGKQLNDLLCQRNLIV